MSTIEKETDIYNSDNPVNTSVNHDDSLIGDGSEADPLALNVQHDDSLSGSGSEADPLKATNIIYITATRELDDSITCAKTFSEIETIINGGKQLPIINFTDIVFSSSYKLYYHGFDDADNIKKYKFASCDNYHYNDHYGFITSLHITDEISNNLHFKNIKVIEKLNVMHDDSLMGDGSGLDPLSLNIKHDECFSGAGSVSDKLKFNYMFRTDATGGNTIYDVIASIPKNDQGYSSINVEFSIQSWGNETEICNYIVRINSRSNLFYLKTICIPNKSNQCSVYYFERDDKAYLALKKEPYCSDSIILLKNLSNGASFEFIERVSSITETLTESTYQIIS